MQFIVVLAVLAAVVKAHPSGVVAPLVAAPVAITAKLVDSEFDPNPQYSFAYDVQDTLTGDSKSHAETRNGGLVQGQYSVSDPDGTRRIVDYSADPINGFNAVVRKAPLVKAVAAAPVLPAAPLLRAAPAPLVAAAPAPLVAAQAPIVAARSPYVAAASPYVAAASPYAYPASALAPRLSFARLAYSSPYAVY